VALVMDWKGLSDGFAVFITSEKRYHFQGITIGLRRRVVGPLGDYKWIRM